MNKKGGVAGGFVIWILGFFIGLVFIITLVGAIIGIIIWIVCFIVGLVVMTSGGGTKVIVQQSSQTPSGQSHTIVLPAPQIMPTPQTHMVEKIVVKCSQCETKNDEDAGFCKKCGKSLNTNVA